MIITLLESLLQGFRIKVPVKDAGPDPEPLSLSWIGDLQQLWREEKAAREKQNEDEEEYDEDEGWWS